MGRLSTAIKAISQRVRVQCADGLVNYWNRLLGGSFSTALSVTRTTEDTSNLSTVGLLSVVNYSRRIALWT